MVTFVSYRQYVLSIALCVSQYVSYWGFFRIDQALVLIVLTQVWPKVELGTLLHNALQNASVFW